MIFNVNLHLLFAVQARLNKVNNPVFAKRKLIIPPKDINLLATFTYYIKKVEAIYMFLRLLVFCCIENSTKNYILF